LTGAFNRAYFNAFMDKILAYAGRYEKQLSFIMVDLDAFKSLNDTYGHPAGDAMLVEAAKLLRNNMRDSDLLFRYGGDEFLVVLSNADCERAQVVQERIKRSVNEWNKYDPPAFLSLGCLTEPGDVVVHHYAMMYRENWYIPLERRNQASETRSSSPSLLQDTNSRKLQAGCLVTSKIQGLGHEENIFA
jgi:diguanylate cyclase (GGDEF)-like protein